MLGSRWSRLAEADQRARTAEEAAEAARRDAADARAMADAALQQAAAARAQQPGAPLPAAPPTTEPPAPRAAPSLVSTSTQTTEPAEPPVEGAEGGLRRAERRTRAGGSIDVHPVPPPPPRPAEASGMVVAYAPRERRVRLAITSEANLSRKEPTLKAVRELLLERIQRLEEEGVEALATPMDLTIEDVYMQRYGLPPLAEKHACRFLASILHHLHASPLLETYARLVGVIHPPMSLIALNTFVEGCRAALAQGCDPTCERTELSRSEWTRLVRGSTIEAVWETIDYDEWWRQLRRRRGDSDDRMRVTSVVLLQRCARAMLACSRATRLREEAEQVAGAPALSPVTVARLRQRREFDSRRGRGGGQQRPRWAHGDEGAAPPPAKGRGGASSNETRRAGGRPAPEDELNGKVMLVHALTMLAEELPGLEAPFFVRLALPILAAADVNGSGILDEHEVGALVRAFNPRASERTIGRVFAELLASGTPGTQMGSGANVLRGADEEVAEMELLSVDISDVERACSVLRQGCLRQVLKDCPLVTDSPLLSLGATTPTPAAQQPLPLGAKGSSRAAPGHGPARPALGRLGSFRSALAHHERTLLPQTGIEALKIIDDEWRLLSANAMALASHSRLNEPMRNDFARRIEAFGRLLARSHTLVLAAGGGDEKVVATVWYALQMLRNEAARLHEIATKGSSGDEKKAKRK